MRVRRTMFTKYVHGTSKYDSLPRLRAASVCMSRVSMRGGPSRGRPRFSIYRKRGRRRGKRRYCFRVCLPRALAKGLDKALEKNDMNISRVYADLNGG